MNKKRITWLVQCAAARLCDQSLLIHFYDPKHHLAAPQLGCDALDIS
jgi:hypothetical protein